MSKILEQGVLAFRELKRRAQARAFLDFVPYESQARVIQAKSMILAIFGGNQAGKTYAGAHTIAYHVTGRYPSWWTGRRWSTPPSIWVVGENNSTTRDILQKMLFGPDANDPGEGGLIPKECIKGKPTFRSNLPGAFDIVRIEHASGGTATMQFKSYEQGRESLASFTGDIVWVDEEPPWDCFEELVMRVIRRSGQVLMTFTPLRGFTPLVNLLLGRNQSDSELLKKMPVTHSLLGWDQAKHLSETDKDAVKTLFAGNPGQLNARMTGMPTANQGLILPHLNLDILIEPFPLEKMWPRLGGLDVGFRHPTGAVVCAHDQDSDTVYLYDAYRQEERRVEHHVAELRRFGDVDFMIDPASNTAEKQTGVETLNEYLTQWYGDEETWRELPAQALKFRKARNQVYPSINELASRISSCRLWMFNTPAVRLVYDELSQWAWDKNENNQKPLKVNDDLVDPTRYALLGIRDGNARVMGRRLPVDMRIVRPDLVEMSQPIHQDDWKAPRPGY